MLSLQAISDRLELEDLSYAYARAIDSRDFEALANDVFSPDVRVDFSASGGPIGNIDDMLAWVRPGMGAFSDSHHLMANHHFVIDGDRATGRVMCYNPLLGPLGKDGSGKIIVVGLYYIDEYVRTQSGWRISSRKIETTYCFSSSQETMV